jgi:hypothetical protein
VTLDVRVLSWVRFDVLDDLVATISFLRSQPRGESRGSHRCWWLDAGARWWADPLYLALLRGLASPLFLDAHGRRDGGFPAGVIATANPFWLPTVVVWRAKAPVIALVYDVD